MTTFSTCHTNPGAYLILNWISLPSWAAAAPSIEHHQESKGSDVPSQAFYLGPQARNYRQGTQHRTCDTTLILTCSGLTLMFGFCSSAMFATSGGLKGQ